jgi:hypothetical protein
MAGQPHLWLTLLAHEAGRNSALARRMAVLQSLRTAPFQTRETLTAAVEDELGPGCFGADPAENLWNDVAELRAASIPIAYSRSKDHPGYYLVADGADPDFELQLENLLGEISPVEVAVVRGLSPAKRMETLFAMADSARDSLVSQVQQSPDDSDEKQRQAIASRFALAHEWAALT